MRFADDEWPLNGNVDGRERLDVGCQIVVSIWQSANFAASKKHFRRGVGVRGKERNQGGQVWERRKNLKESRMGGRQV